jgi:hypothetical protein
MTQRVAEFLMSDAGGVTLSVRPQLPFLPDGVRISGSCVELYGDAKRILLQADPELIEALGQAGGLLLLEHASDGSGPPRELELLLID